MLDKVAQNEYYNHIRRSNLAISNVQWQDQFEFKINMEKPQKKEIVPPELIKSFSLHYNCFTIESSKIGTQTINYYFDAEPLKIDVVFYNPIQIGGGLLGKDENIIDYLTKIDGQPIVPRDGTFLLNNEYNFFIECYALDGAWNKKLLAKGYFVINGELMQDFVSNGGGMQEVPITFEVVKF